MQTAKDYMPKREALSQEQKAQLMRDLFVQYLNVSTLNSTRANWTRKKAMTKECAGIYKNLREDRVAIEHALAAYSCLGIQGLVGGLQEQAKKDKQKHKPISAAKVLQIISFLLSDSPEKVDEVARCFKSWSEHPDVPKNLSFMLNDEMRAKLFQRLGEIKPKPSADYTRQFKSAEQHVAKKGEANLPIVDPRKSPGSSKSKH